jgi:REP element-mobilizing transposase RayT
MSGEHPGWHSRGYLPHFDPGVLVQSVTFRLADSLPKSKLLELEHSVPKGQHAQLRAQIEDWLDRGAGSCALRNPACAAIVQDALLFFDTHRYRLLSWCIMPNHVHLLLLIFDGHPLDRVMHSIKSFTATKINQLLGLRGPLWQPEYFDRFIRSADHFANEVNYIEYNPVAAGLCQRILAHWQHRPS